MHELVSISTACGALQFDPAVGNIPVLRFDWAGRAIEPLYAAPWREEPETQSDPVLSPAERRLAGDFFCAPFATTADPAVPAHGWSANSAWHLQEHQAGQITFVLERLISGATFTKMLAIADDAPLLYQEHRIDGGSGLLPVAHHPMVRLKGRGRFFASRKRAVLTADEVFEPGCSHLAYPMRVGEPEQAAGAKGERVDLTRWPIAMRNEDFVTLVEAAGAGLGWSAVLREEEDDIVFFLKDPSVLPVTMLWFSNGGRDYVPWSGRFSGVTGIEDGCAPGAAGEAAAGGPNPVASEGVPTGLALAPGREHVVRHVTGAIPRPAGWNDIAGIAIDGDELTISDSAGRQVTLPWRRDFLRGND